MSELEQDKTNNIETVMPEVICSLLTGKGYQVQPLKKFSGATEVILVKSTDILAIATLLKMHKETQFDLLYSVTSVDHPDKFEVVYHLQSTKLNKKLVLKAHLTRNNPEIESISSVYSAANWHERETYDLMGIVFKNHPNLERILMPKDWKGHPLRKDYKMDDERLVWNER